MVGTSDQSCWLAEACKILLLFQTTGLLDHPKFLACQCHRPMKRQRLLEAAMWQVPALITTTRICRSAHVHCTGRYCAVLCCAVLYCTVLYCTVLYCTVLYCTVLYCTVLYCTVLYCTVLYCTVLYCTVLYCTVLYCTVLYCTVPTVPYRTVSNGQKNNQLGKTARSTTQDKKT